MRLEQGNGIARDTHWVHHLEVLSQKTALPLEIWTWTMLGLLILLYVLACPRESC